MMSRIIILLFVCLISSCNSDESKAEASIEEYLKRKIIDCQLIKITSLTPVPIDTAIYKSSYYLTKYEWENTLDNSKRKVTSYFELDKELLNIISEYKFDMISAIGKNDYIYSDKIEERNLPNEIIKRMRADEKSYEEWADNEFKKLLKESQNK